MSYLPYFSVLTHEPGKIAIQGMGGGGILSLTQIILSDLVPLRERGIFNGLLGMCVLCLAGLIILSLHLIS
jgi:MFS family permease